MKRIKAFAVVTAVMLFTLCACGKTEVEQNTGSQTGSTSEGAENMSAAFGGTRISRRVRNLQTMWKTGLM